MAAKIIRSGNSSGGRVGKPIGPVHSGNHGSAKGPGCCCGK